MFPPDLQCIVILTSAIAETFTLREHGGRRRVQSHSWHTLQEGRVRREHGRRQELISQPSFRRRRAESNLVTSTQNGSAFTNFHARASPFKTRPRLFAS